MPVEEFDMINSAEQSPDASDDTILTFVLDLQHHLTTSWTTRFSDP